MAVQREIGVVFETFVFLSEKRSNLNLSRLPKGTGPA